jgi:hypothetical protein
MQGNKLAKDQEKIRRRLYRKTAHRFGQTYRPRRLRRWWADAQDARKEGASP